MHYSQWNLREQEPRQYLARYFRCEYEPFAGLFAEYHKKVRQEGLVAEACPPRIYGEVIAPCGKPVPDLLRRVYEGHGPAVDGDASEVFARAEAVLNASSNARAELPGLPLTVLYDEIWQRHADLRYRFNVDQASGRLAYLQWLVEAGAAELEIPAVFVTPARSVLARERVRQLEARDEAAAVPRTVADPGLPVLPEAAETVAGLIAARDAERDQLRRQDTDIGLLVSSNKALRRELQALRVRRWRDEETIQALDEELARTKLARARANRRSRQLTDEVATLHARPWHSVAGWLGSRARSGRAKFGRRPILPGDGPFYDRGFRLGDAGAIADAAVKRVKSAPTGILIFGPYVKLAAGTYAATIEARLYQRPPVVTSFKLEIVCDDARQLIGSRNFRLYSIGGWQRFELIFAVWEGEDFADFETRIWARKGTPLEIGRIDLSQLTEEPTAASAGAADPDESARLP